MKRRRFLQNLAAGAAGISCLPAAVEPAAAGPERESNLASRLEEPGWEADVEGYTLLCNFDRAGRNWNRTRSLASHRQWSAWQRGRTAKRYAGDFPWARKTVRHKGAMRLII